MKRLLVLLVFFISMAELQAQDKPASKGMPKLKVTLGRQSNANISANVFKQVVDSILVVQDDKGNNYPVTHFRINYSFLSSSKDPETEQVKTIKDFLAYDIYDSNQLPETWRSNLKENAKKGDEILFSNITVKQKNGKKIFAPDWKGTLQ